LDSLKNFQRINLLNSASASHSFTNVLLL